MTQAWIDFDYALIRVVPSVHRGSFVNVGVVLHAPTKRHLAGKFLDDLEPLRPLWNGIDLDRLRRYLDSLDAIIRGEAGAGALARLSTSERFHWMTAPRSDVIQASPCHPARALDLDEALDSLFDLEVSLKS